MKSIVIDASVVVTALLEENIDVENGFKYILHRAKNGSVRLLSSKLLPIEVANAFRFAVTDREKCFSIWRDACALPIKTVLLSKHQLAETIKISYMIGTTVYDTSYHILAKANNALFVTCDHSYYQKAKMLGDIEILS